ncbi:MAG: hypothetical protein ACREPR_06950 [Brasilonema sp.]
MKETRTTQKAATTGTNDKSLTRHDITQATQQSVLLLRELSLKSHVTCLKQIYRKVI